MTGRTLLVVALASAILAAPGDARAEAGSWILRLPTTIGCASGEFALFARGAVADEATYGVRTFVDVNGTRYTDEAATQFIGTGDFELSWSLVDNNSGGTATGTWPLPTGQAMTVTSRLTTLAGEPLWESRATFDGCATASLEAFSNGPVHQLAQNGSFEIAKGKKAGAWKGGKRECAPTPVVRSRTGECELVMKKGKARQTFAPLETPVDSFDQLRFAAHVEGTDVGPGSTISMTMTFETGDPVVLSAPIPEGTYDYQRVEVAPHDVVSVPQTITITIQKAGGGSISVDDVELYLAENAVPPI
jgi:hypothetical protein